MMRFAFQTILMEICLVSHCGAQLAAILRSEMPYMKLLRPKASYK